MSHLSELPVHRQPELTLFTLPKPFRGNIGTIQRNAIQSWTLLRPPCEIVLFGDEEGVAEAASEFGVLHVPGLERNEYGTPLVNDVLEKAQRLAASDWLCLVNTDIILPGNFLDVFARVRREMDRFMLVGRRCDLDVTERLEFGPGWEEELRRQTAERGRLMPPFASDYFVFPRGLLNDVPPFAIGRLAYDNWFFYKALRENCAVVDATAVILAVHQNHDYGSYGTLRQMRWSPEAIRNIELAKQDRKTRYSFSMKDTTHVVRPDGIRTNPMRHVRKAVSMAWEYAPLAAIMRGYVRVKKWLGLDYAGWKG